MHKTLHIKCNINGRTNSDIIESNWKKH